MTYRHDDYQQAQDYEREARLYRDLEREHSPLRSFLARRRKFLADTGRTEVDYTLCRAEVDGGEL